MELSETAKVVGILAAASVVITAACKAIGKLFSAYCWIRGHWRCVMPEIEQSDPWWTPRG
jgi:hypothetical protein